MFFPLPRWERERVKVSMEERNKLTVTLETVTPLFLGGAEAQDRNRSPELRPPAFRGALRYWLRAALGGVIGDNNLDGLHRLESAVFGSTECYDSRSLQPRGTLLMRDSRGTHPTLQSGRCFGDGGSLTIHAGSAQESSLRRHQSPPSFTTLGAPNPTWGAV